METKKQTYLAGSLYPPNQTYIGVGEAYGDEDAFGPQGQ